MLTLKRASKHRPGGSSLASAGRMRAMRRKPVHAGVGGIVDERRVRHLWQCDACGYAFETTVSYEAMAA